MKKLTKLFALLLVLALTLGTVSIVMADEPPVGSENEITTGPVTITNAMAGVTYKLYRVMDIHGVTADGQKSAFVTNEKWHTIFGDDSLKDFLTLKDKNTVGTLVTPVLCSMSAAPLLSNPTRRPPLPKAARRDSAICPSATTSWFPPVTPAHTPSTPPLRSRAARVSA